MVDVVGEGAPVPAAPGTCAWPAEIALEPTSAGGRFVPGGRMVREQFDHVLMCRRSSAISAARLEVSCVEGRRSRTP